MRITRHRVTIMACLALAACQDSTRIVQPTVSVQLNESEGRGWFHRYVAIGTSVSMGWHSDGVDAAGQLAAWPHQLAHLAQRDITLPLLDGFGCKAPLAAPLITFLRTSGESAGVSNANALCSPNKAFVVLPTQNVAISGATTSDALTRTPELQSDPLFAQLYRRVLPLGATQVSAMEGQNPKFVSVELGANDILSVLSGIAISGVTITPFSAWSTAYSQILDRVGAVTRYAVVTGFGVPAANIPGLRRGSELHADSLAFSTNYHVDVSSDCAGSSNLVFTPVVVPTAVATGLVRRANGLPPFLLSCTPGSPTTVDRILSASEESTANAALALMDGHIQSEAAAHGYAIFELGALYNRPKATYSVVHQMTSATPYGPYVSLDGVHPSALGHTILADAAAQAIDAQYNLGLTSVALGSAAWLRH